MELTFTRSFETAKLFEILEKLAPGESISYTEMSRQATFDVSKYTGRIGYVRDQLKRKGKAVIVLAPNGLRRLPDVEVVNLHSQRYKRRVGMASLRGSRALTSVDYEALSDVERTAHNAHQSGFGAIRLFTKETTHKKIAAGVEMAKVTLPTRDLLKLFEK